MAELRVVGKYRGPGERLAAETLAQELPADWVLIANRSMPTQEHDDLDLTVVGRNLVFVVEGKHWGPTVEIGPGAWVVKGQPRENPTDRVAFLARKLAGLLRSQVRGYPRKRRIVDSYVLLSYPNLELDRSEAGPESDMVVLLADATQALLKRDKEATAAVGAARNATIAFLDGWKERDAVPDHIGAYKVHREIAPLGRARVFAAQDDVGSFIFLRCYPMDGWGPDVDPNNLVRRERKAIQKLAQSGRTLESQPVFEDDLHRWIVVPIVQQQLANLPRLLSMPDPPLHPATSHVDEVVRFVIDAYAALREIHAEGVIHRGIAPARVALDAKGWVKFTDLYLAQVSGEITVAASLNEMADLGAPFRAPECKDFIGAATTPSDVYSLGLSLLWWLHGDPPKAAHPTPIRDDLADVADVLRRCTAPVQADRPLIDVVVADLTALLPAADEPTQSQETSAMFAPGQVIAGRYSIERLLGEGGFAKSWLAVDQWACEKRVLKQYHSGAVPDQTARKEFDAASKLVHERCARVWDISPDHSFLVIEYVEGESLGKASMEEISPDDYRSYALDILDALAYMHGRDFLHNDISPGNIILEPEGRARLIDFGFTRLRETHSKVAFTRAFAAPEVENGKKLSPASDMYALGASFLHSMLRRYPYEDSDTGYDKSKLRALSDEEQSALGPLGVAISEQFFRLVSPDPEDRPPARAFADDLRRTAPIVMQGGDPKINPTVDALRQLYRGSKLGNAGNRGLDSEFAEATYVETLLDTALTPRIISGDLELVILTGNPGDGKTSYLKKLRGRLLASGAQMLRDGLGGWLCRTSDRTFAAVYDASEARAGKTSDELVADALTAAEAGIPHTALLAINDGRLRQFFIRDHSDVYPEYHKAVRKGLRGEPPDKTTSVAYVDLKRRSLAPTASDPSGIAGRTLDTFTQESRWAACTTCSAREACPILRNRTQLAGPGRAHLLNLVVISHLRRQRRATFRDFRSAAGWVLTGDRGCEDVHQAIEGDIDLWRGDDALHFDLAFDSRSTDYLIAEWSDIDPTRLPVAALEREDRASAGRESWHRRESLNRRAFFGDLDGDTTHLREATPYRYLEDIQGALASDESTRELLPRILLGLSRLLGAFGYDGPNLALQDGENDGWAVLREIDAAEFRLERRAPESPYVEQQADELLLMHRRACLALTLDSVELILRAADGELINDAAASAIKLELSLLAGRLMLHPAPAAIVVNPAGVPQTVSEVDGSIVLGSRS